MGSFDLFHFDELGEVSRKEKWKGFKLISNNIHIIRIDIIGFCVKVIRELVYSIMIHLFLLYIHLEGEY